MLSVYLCLHEGLIVAKSSPTYNGDNGTVVGGQNAEPNKWKWQCPNMIWLVAFLSCIGLIGAKPSPPYNGDNGRVVGGQNAEPNKWKWQISLQLGSYEDGYFSHICGGSIIDPFYIMTAAHCIISSNPREYRVVSGEYNMNEDEGSEQFSSVERIIVHPGWTHELGNGNDIALMKLSQPIYDNGYVGIAELPAPDQTLPHNFDLWGTSPPVLQEALLPVVEHSVCSQPEWWGVIALKTMVCAGGDGVLSGCQGDSGGPLNCFTDGAWRVHGVVSYGPAGMCNQYRKPTVFTRVSSFLDWIYSVTRS
uniref:Elastase-1-like n=1 Tax=Takifugu rubripes TaxID=31033 RepID=H2V858_TAKRU